MIAGPDSRAQIAIQAAERLRALGAGVPWEISPPLPPALIAGLSAIPGMTPELAYAVLVWMTFAGSAAAVYLLWRRMGSAPAVAVQAAVLALVAPSGFLAIWERGEIDRLLFWKAVPLVFLAVDAFRRKPGALRVGLVLATLISMLLTRSERWVAVDLLALAEWVAIVALCAPWRAATARRRFAAIGAVAAFACIAGVRLDAIQEPGATPMPAGFANAHGAVGPVSLDAELHPFAWQVHELIRSELRPRESLLWLRALGAKSVVAPRYGKFYRELECIEERDGWCVFDVPGPAPRAVLVSRDRFETLEPIRGLFDIEGLERYLTWAVRPEAVGFEQRGPEIVVRGEAGPNDLVLVRTNVAECRTMSRFSADPMGYFVLDPGGAGPFEAILDHESAPPARRTLDVGDYPALAAEGVVEASTYQASPFAPGAYVAIYGERFHPFASRVLVDEGEARLEYVSTTQINVRLANDLQPGPHALVVDSAGRRTYPYAFEVKTP